MSGQQARAAGLANIDCGPGLPFFRCRPVSSALGHTALTCNDPGNSGDHRRSGGEPNRPDRFTARIAYASERQ
jgi:hypothetical protein